MTLLQRTTIKVCGITNVEDAVFCVENNIDAIGLNFVPGTKRFIDHTTACVIVEAVAGRTLVVGVIADLSLSDTRQLIEKTGIKCVQLHGDESPDTLRALQPHAYKAVPIASLEDAEKLAKYPGNYILADSKVHGVLGGSGESFDWALVVAEARKRKLALAGGLNPSNVVSAIRQVRPFCVDVASGVETTQNPRRKDHNKIRDFIDAVIAADQEIASLK